MKKLLWIPMAVAVMAGPLALAQHGDWEGHRGGPPMHSPYSPHYMPHGHSVHELPLGFARLFIGGMEYFYWEGMYYRMAQSGYVVVPAPVGALVSTVPEGCQQVVVDGTVYNIINGVTYMRTPYGYQVVPMPSVLMQPAPPPAPYVPGPPPVPATAPAAAPVENTPAADAAGVTNDVFVVNIPNAKGTYTPVSLRRSGTGFFGPQGEFYTEFPRVEQLKVMYGK